MIQKLKDLDELNMSHRSGIHKRWIYKDELSLEISGDYLQKIAFSISDYNKELEIKNKEPKDIIFMIILASWIRDTFKLLLKTYKDEVLVGYQPSDLSVEDDYLRAIRSFVAAHPMNTNKHSKFNFTGSYICNDICMEDKLIFSFMNDDSVFWIDMQGIHNGKNSYDYLLKVYSASDKMKLFKYICCKIDDITYCISKYIDELYKFSYFLGKLKKRDFNEGV